MPLVWPLAHEYWASPNQGHSPNFCLAGHGKAEPCRTSGGRAALTNFGGKASRLRVSIGKLLISRRCEIILSHASFPATHLSVFASLHEMLQGIRIAR